MKRKFLLLIIFTIATVTTGCGEDKFSRPITMYKYYVGTGNGVVTFVTRDDKNGEISMLHCEELKVLYERKYKERYMCAPRTEDDLKIDVKWD